MRDIPPPVNATWFKSSASGSSNCVEVAHAGERVLVRDSKNPAAAMLQFTHDEWAAFLTGVRLGEFDVPATSA